jgi:hypothetical protein
LPPYLAPQLYDTVVSSESTASGEGQREGAWTCATGGHSLSVFCLFFFCFCFQPENTKSLDRKMPLQLVGPKIKPSTTGSFVSCNYEYLVEAGISMGQSRRSAKTGAAVHRLLLDYQKKAGGRLQTAATLHCHSGA